MLLLIAYFANTISKLFFDIYELHNALCNAIICKISFIFTLLVRQSRFEEEVHYG